MTYSASQLWSLQALAAELGLDRRTLRARLREVPPDGQLKGHPAWFFRSALAAVRFSDEVDADHLDAERERAGLLRQQRLKTEFEVGILKGKYLDAAEVEAADAVIMTALRDRIRAVSSCAPVLVQASLQGGELAVKHALANALDAALEEMGSQEVVSDSAAHTQGM